jgi:hypothetical protein
VLSLRASLPRSIRQGVRIRTSSAREPTSWALAREENYLPGGRLDQGSSTTRTSRVIANRRQDARDCPHQDDRSRKGVVILQETNGARRRKPADLGNYQSMPATPIQAPLCFI